jgi:hypothetical protein
MPVKDLANNVQVNDGSVAVDIRNYQSVIAIGASAITLEESDDGSSFTDVAADDLITPVGGSEQNSAFQVGYRGSKQYLRSGVGTYIVGGDLNRVPPGSDLES